MNIIPFIDRAAPLNNNSAVSTLGNERKGVVFDFLNMQAYITNPDNPEHFYAGHPSGVLSYTAPSPKYVHNASGKLESSVSLRCDHDPYTKEPLGALIEPQSTNLSTYSESFDNWTLTNATFSNSSIPSPISGVNYKRLDALGGVTSNIRQQLSGVGVAGGMTLSAYVKKGSGATHLGQFAIRDHTNSDTLIIYNFNFDNGSYTTIGGTQTANSTLKAQRISIDEWRVSVTCTAGISNGSQMWIYVGNAGLTTPSAQHMYMTGVQFEPLPYSTSYIKTEASSVTRAADNITMPLTRIPFNTQEGSVISEHLVRLYGVTPTYPAVWAFLGLGNNVIHLYNQTVSGAVRIFINDNIGVLTDFGTGFFTTGDKVKVAVKFAEEEVATSVNNSTPVITSLIRALPDLTLLSIGRSSSTTLSSHVKSFVYLPRLLSNTELQEWSTL